MIFEGGTKLAGKRLYNISGHPLITIVTVVYNNVYEIEKTIKNVLGQTYDNIEYIVIDGGSTDGTVDVIKKYDSQIYYWISESDKGIYDAMNKGISLATGEWINFMNSGDIFVNQDLVKNIFINNYADQIAVIYGKNISRFLWGTYVRTPESLKKMTKMFCFNHQASFVRASVHKRIPFDLSYKVVADYNFFKTIYQNNKDSFFYFPHIISVTDRSGGTTMLQYDRLLTEMKIVNNHRNIIKNIKQKLRKIIPAKCMLYIYKIMFFFKLNYKKIVC